VLQTESVHQLVYVQKELLKLKDKISVHNVNHNVTDVKTELIIVLPVLTDTLTHQHVQ
jgi:hypothetical protein